MFIDTVSESLLIQLTKGKNIIIGAIDKPLDVDRLLIRLKNSVKICINANIFPGDVMICLGGVQSSGVESGQCSAGFMHGPV